MRLAVLAGDGRERAAALELARRGHEVRTFGGLAGPLEAEGPVAAMAGVDAVLGPALGTNPAGDHLRRSVDEPPLLLREAWLEAPRRGAPWVLGSAGPWLRRQVAARAGTVHTYVDAPSFAVRNAVPTAEGAIAEATRRAGRTVWGTSALVVGGGRCGLALTRRLVALGADVVCAGRTALERAAIASAGARPIATDAPALAAAAAGGQLLFNTVPAPLIDARVLESLPAGAVVVDLASSPGGTDFAAAESLGVQAALLPGIPGRMYPETAGRIVADVLLELLAGRTGGDTDGGYRGDR